MLPQLYLSRPATVLPDRAVDNEEALSWARDAFRGSANEWESIEQIIRWVFDRCNTQMRYLEGENLVSPGEFAAQAATACLAENGVAATDIDLLIYGGVARDAFEPATATEVAGRLGATPLVALDVTCACAGLLEALHVAAGYFALHPDVQTALICAGEITRDRINYDMQNVEDVMVNVAGLTLGNAAAAMLVTREALDTGGARLLELVHKTRAEHWDLCRAPIDGHFTSKSKELFALSVHVVPEVQAMLDNAGWHADEVNHYAFHQPSQAVLEKIFGDLGAKPDAAIHTHARYGNTASTAWALALEHRMRHEGVRHGDKIVLGSAAAGFTIVAATAVWEDGKQAVGAGR